jgi:hypothetical protein
MVWSQYIADAHTEDMDLDDESMEETPLPRNLPLDYQDWITWYSDDLMNMWLSLKQYSQDSGNQYTLLDGMEWTDFCEFCYRFSCKLPS